MITFQEFSYKLARGQLKNTPAGDSTNGEICPDYVDTILSLTNQGLVDISSKLPIIKKMVDLIFVTGQNVYPLLDLHLGGFLSDADTESFDETVFVKTIDIYAADGTRYSPNTEGHITSPVYNSLRFSTSVMEDLIPKIRIQYQANHVLITEDDNIDIPPNLVTALQLYVSSLYISHMGGKEHSQKGDKYFAAYLRHIGEDVIQDTSSTSEVDENDKFFMRGFV